jgi:dCMP deaminase
MPAASHEDLLRLAFEHALGSPDPSTQNAAFLFHPTAGILFATLETNHFPDGIQETEWRWDKAQKYSYVEHAERNAIYAAARAGIQTDGLWLIAAWAACADCARAIIQSGITTLIRYIHTEGSTWDGSISIADGMLTEAGVNIIEVTEPIANVTPLRRGGNVWLPDGVRV